MGHKPRDYQEACIKAHFNYFSRRRGNPLFVVPTGGGKSLIIAEFVRRTIERWPDQRVIILTHVKELIEQNYDEFLNQWGLLAPVGIYSAGVGKRETGNSVTFAGIQTVWHKIEGPNPAAEELGAFDLVLIDEAHLVPKTGMGRYRAYLDYLKKLNPNVKILGYTATPFRLEGGLLHKGDGKIFDHIAYDVPVEKLIKDEFLAPLVAKDPKNCIDTSLVGSARGDFKIGELEEAAMSDTNTEDAVDEMVRFAQEGNRRHWLVFACGVEHAERILSLVRGHGVSAELLTGATPAEERASIVGKAKAGNICCLVNVGVLTTGFNWPRCDMLAVMRPTKSTALYVQIMGRGMRTFPGKENCLVLDYGENVKRHGPINDLRMIEHGLGGDGVAPTKTCPECRTICHLSAEKCEECGYEFPVESRSAMHTAHASDSAPIDMNKKYHAPHSFPVFVTEYEKHRPRDGDKPDCLKVTYICGLRRFYEYVCLNHTGFARRKAEQWWRWRSKLLSDSPEHGQDLPRDVDEGLARREELHRVKEIVVQREGKFDRVIDATFKEQPREAESATTTPEPTEDVEQRTEEAGESAARGSAEPRVRPW